jgi:hypothetical protein
LKELRIEDRDENRESRSRLRMGKKIQIEGRARDWDKDHEQD